MIKRLWSQQEKLSNPKQPRFKKKCVAHCEKRCEMPRNGCDGKILTIQVNLCCLLHISLGFGTKFTWIVVIKNFVITAIFWPPPWISQLFSQWPFWGRTFLQLGCFGLDFTFFAIAYCIAYLFFSFGRYQVDNFHTWTL